MYHKLDETNREKVWESALVTVKQTIFTWHYTPACPGKQ